MGWGSGTNAAGRKVGYLVRGVCDKDGCRAKIDRGLYYVCGGMHDGADVGCGGYFCEHHLGYMSEFRFPQLCDGCMDRLHDLLGTFIMDPAGRLIHRCLAADEAPAELTRCGKATGGMELRLDDENAFVDAYIHWARCLACWAPASIDEDLERDGELV